jgi:hypothetical protein
MRRKTGGRKVGTPNKATAEMRERLQGIFDRYAEGQLQLDMKATDPDTRLKFALEVAKLITPKPPTIAGFDQQERPIFTGIDLDVQDKPCPAPIIITVKDMSQPDPPPDPHGRAQILIPE